MGVPADLWDLGMRLSSPWPKPKKGPESKPEKDSEKDPDEKLAARLPEPNP
jgi:hypothetical protein